MRKHTHPQIAQIKAGCICEICVLCGWMAASPGRGVQTLGRAKELIKRDVPVVTTGCNAFACAKVGLMWPETAEQAGEGLKGVCRALSIPTVLHMGSCIDISHILAVCAAIASVLGADISDLPVAVAAPEWMSEK